MYHNTTENQADVAGLQVGITSIQKYFNAELKKKYEGIEQKHWKSNSESMNRNRNSSS